MKKSLKKITIITALVILLFIELSQPSGALAAKHKMGQGAVTIRVSVSKQTISLTQDMIIITPTVIPNREKSTTVRSKKHFTKSMKLVDSLILIAVTALVLFVRRKRDEK